MKYNVSFFKDKDISFSESFILKKKKNNCPLL